MSEETVLYVETTSSSLGVVRETFVLEDHTPKVMLSLEQDQVALTTVGEQGPQGPAGPDGGLEQEYTAGESVGGHRVVYVDEDGAVRYADCTEAAHAFKIAGLTLEASTAGNPVRVQTYGVVAEPSLNLSVDDQIYLGSSGLFTQTPPVSRAFLLSIGGAVATTKLFLRIGPPIFGE